MGEKQKRKTKQTNQPAKQKNPWSLSLRINNLLSEVRWNKVLTQRYLLKNFLWGRFVRYVQLKAPKMSAAMNSVFPAFSSDGHSLGCARREFIHTKDECSPSSCLSPQHWVVIPAREVTRGSVSCLKHDLAWHCLYVFSSKTPTDIRIFFHVAYLIWFKPSYMKHKGLMQPLHLRNRISPHHSWTCPKVCCGKAEQVWAIFKMLVEFHSLKQSLLHWVIPLR